MGSDYIQSRSPFSSNDSKTFDFFTQIFLHTKRLMKESAQGFIGVGVAQSFVFFYKHIIYFLSCVFILEKSCNLISICCIFSVMGLYMRTRYIFCHMTAWIPDMLSVMGLYMSIRYIFYHMTA